MREWIQERLGVVGAGVICLVAVGVLGYFMFREDPVLAASRKQVYMCSETGKTFEYTLVEDELFPVESPYSGKRTGYPTEKCFWTADGKAKLEPTYVIMNELIGQEGPTICPDCGRRVLFHNPSPPAELMREAAESR